MQEPFSTPEALGAAIKDNLATWEPFLSVIRRANQRRLDRLENESQESA